MLFDKNLMENVVRNVKSQLFALWRDLLCSWETKTIASVYFSFVQKARKEWRELLLMIIGKYKVNVALLLKKPKCPLTKNQDAFCDVQLCAFALRSSSESKLRQWKRITFLAGTLSNPLAEILSVELDLDGFD